MAIEKFAWPTECGGTPDISYRVRTSKFGNGYAQNVGDGPNNKEDSYPISCVG
jgi:phage-related protein